MVTTKEVYIELFQEPFGQSHGIINAHMKVMLNLLNPSPQLVSSNFMTHWKPRYEVLKHWGTYTLLTWVIWRYFGLNCIKKPPVELKKSLARDHSKKGWALDELRKAILKEAEILEVGESNSDPPELPSSDLVVPTVSLLMGFNEF